MREVRKIATAIRACEKSQMTSETNFPRRVCWCAEDGQVYGLDKKGRIHAAPSTRRQNLGEARGPGCVSSAPEGQPEGLIGVDRPVCSGEQGDSRDAERPTGGESATLT